MPRSILALIGWFVTLLPVFALGEAEPAGSGPVQVTVIPVREEVGRPLHYIIRRGLKEAIDREADVVVLDMNTPGGALDVTFDIMEALERFPGLTLTFVNDEALSAGAFISATTEEIWFAPSGVIGAAAPVLATGGDLDETMQQKIVSYLRARVRATSEGRGYRGEVISAMIDSDFELKIGDRVLKEKGELLSLTATEAAETFGDPPKALLAAGIAADVAGLLDSKFGAGGYEVVTLEVTWSERLAVFLSAIAPLMLGAGLLALYLEFKTPGFGVFGITGAALLAIVFLGNYVAGLSGHEPLLLFFVGVLLVLAELLFFPGVIVVALTGLVFMLGSLVWSMADLWPNEPVTFSTDIFLQPILNVLFGVLIAMVGAVALFRFLPRSWIWNRMVLTAAVGGDASMAGVSAASDVVSAGTHGVAVTALRPSGEVEIDGRRYQASLAVGTAEPGDPIVVAETREFGLRVEKLNNP